METEEYIDERPYLEGIDEAMEDLWKNCDWLQFVKGREGLTPKAASLVNKAHAAMQCALQDLGLLRLQMEEDSGETATFRGACLSQRGIKGKKHKGPASSLDEIMREDAIMADKARKIAYDAQIMGWIAIALSILSIVLSALRLLCK